MRIAVLTNDYPPVCGGAGRIAALQVEILQHAGNDVRVWHKKLDWPNESVFVRFRRHLKDLSARPDIVKEISDWKPEILITHNLTGCGFGTPKKIQKHGARWIHVLHDVQLFEPSGQVQDVWGITLWQGLWSAFRLGSFGKPNLVISPTRWLLKQHRRRGFFLQGRWWVLPNPSPPVERFERNLHQPLRLLFVGRVSREKGSDLLADLIRRLEAPFELHIVGDGPGIEKLRQILPSVIQHGALSIDAVLKRMRESDILLVPSQIEENQPTVILEAASVGLPVIASDIGGVRETLDGAGRACHRRSLVAWMQMIDEIRAAFQDTSNKMYELAECHDPNVYRERFLSLLKSN